jgi:hypothetical protein
MINKLLFAAGALLLVGAVANASGPSGGGTLQLSGEVDASISIAITQDEAGVTLGGSTSAATAGLPITSMYGTADGLVSAGWTKSTQAGTSYTLAGVFDYTVNVANASSANYKLDATLNTSDSVVYKVGGAGVANGSATHVETSGTYGTLMTPAIAVVIPKTLTAGSGAIANTINFTVTAN